MTMRKVRRGAGRLVSAVAAFALVLANVIGACAHAAGHSHTNEDAGCVQQDMSATVVGSADISVQADSEPCNEPADGIDALDFMCHGGIAILATTSFGYVAAKPAQVSIAPEMGQSLPAASLERPPKSAVRV